MNAPAFITGRRPRVLRVFGGRLEGAEYALGPGGSLRLGHALDNDIVLRGTSTRGCRIALHARIGGEDGSGADLLHITLLAGEASLLGQKLEPERPVLLPPFVPLAIGEYSIAVGPRGHERWPEARALAGQLTGYEPSLPAPADDAGRGTLSRSRVASLANHLPRWSRHPAIMVAGAVALFALLGVAPIRDYASRDIADAETARMTLAAGGFAGVTVAQDPGGDRLVFSGTVADEDRLVALRALVAEDFPGARVDVDTGAALARAANDILAAEGLDAEARPVGPGRLAVTSEYLPADRQLELERQLRADLPSLERVRFVLTGERGPGDLAYFFSSGRYGLATFVDGHPGYLITADGSYWFEGARLPTGHEILSARGGRITLERNGLIEEILLDPTPFSPPLQLRSGRGDE